MNNRLVYKKRAANYNYSKAIKTATQAKHTNIKTFIVGKRELCTVARRQRLCKSEIEGAT